MAKISKLLLWRHMRSDPSLHVLQFRRGALARSGRGLAFWFRPLATSIALVPCDDRDQPFVFKGRSRDHQDVTAQGVVTYRVADPEKLARRLDFSIELETGAYTKTPLEQLAQLLNGLCQQLAAEIIMARGMRELLGDGLEAVRARLVKGLPNEPALWETGVEIVSVRVAGLSPSAELEKALQAPTREAIQQDSDKATFERRARAVERELAIQENELQNKIELARREEQLIAQQGQNATRKVREAMEAKRLESESERDRNRLESEARSVRERLEAETQAANIILLDQARVAGEAARMAIVRELPPAVLFGLAAREVGAKLSSIEHLNISPDLLGPLLARLAGPATQS